MSKKRALPANKGMFLLEPCLAFFSLLLLYAECSLDRVQDSGRKGDQFPDQKLRILQDNLVFVNGLPSDTSSRQVLTDELHFSRYGQVGKLIINPQYPNKKGVAYQAYVTYDTHLQASLAIIALDGYKLSDRPLKVSFGTTKYCSHFLRGNNCPNPDCFYLHRFQRTKEVTNGDTRSVFKQQNTKAITTITQNLTIVADKIMQSEVQDIDEGFPSIMETLEYMVDSNQLKPKDIQQAIAQAKIRRQQRLGMPSQMNRVQSTVVNNRQKDKQHPKLIKSNSHSTMCTPTKQDDLAFCPHKNKQEKTQLRQRTLLVKDQRQKRQQASNCIASRQLKLQQKIQKLIIKQIWKKGHVQSRSRFIHGVTSSREECLKLKGIVQKFLIAQN